MTGKVNDVIVTQSLTRQFGSLVAVERLTLAVRQGEMFGLVGPDGSGKSTIIRMLCGILVPTSGSASVLGLDLLRETDGIKKQIGYLSQKFSLYGDLSIDENIEFFAEINGVYDYHARRNELLEFTRLTPFRDRLAEKLSGGMRQKLALACTLIHTPRILFLDEPTTGVDPVSRRDFWKILHSLLKDGITIFMSTPYLDEAERCTRVAFLDRGSILKVDTPGSIKKAMTGDVVEVVVDRVRESARLLKENSMVQEVQAFGDRLNLILANADTALGAVLDALHNEGIRVEGTRVIPPSLENVFISLLSQRREDEVLP